jgi:integrase
VVDFLWRQATLNPSIEVAGFDDLISEKLDETVFRTRLGNVATFHNLNQAFNTLLDELKLKTGADGKSRTSCLWRRFHTKQDYERRVSTHALSKQLGNMIDSHYSPSLNAELHSGRKQPMRSTASLLKLHNFMLCMIPGDIFELLNDKIFY